MNPSVGIGLRLEACDATLSALERLDILEVMVDHYIAGGHTLREVILDVCRRVPVVSHGIGLSLGTAEPLDEAYLDRVAATIETLGASWHSEHLAFTRAGGKETGELLPLPRTAEVAEFVADRVRHIRQRLAVPFAIENITYYFEYPQSEMSEREFIELICRESGALLLLDVENVNINARNHHFDARQFVTDLPPGLVKGVHIAGGETVESPWLLDSHDAPLDDGVLSLLAHVLRDQQPETVVLERDDGLDRFDEVLADVERVRDVVRTVRGTA